MILLSRPRMAVCCLLLLSSATLAHAQATRTWVSGVGDDANPCSRTAPCKTFAGAISRTAAGGEINVLDSAGYGSVTITKSITIDGEGAHAGILASSTNGININGAGIRVTIRNVDIEGHGTTMGLRGINIINAASVLIENVKIQHFNTAPAQGIFINSSSAVRVVIKNVTINANAANAAPGTLGIDIASQVASVHVQDTAINDMASNGIRFQPTSGSAALYLDNVYTRNTAGVYVQSGRVAINGLRAEGNVKGVLAGPNALVTVRNSNIVGNGEGVAANAVSAVINVENCVVSHNMWGLSASAGSTIRVSNSGILSNSIEGMFNSGSFIVSLGGNSIQGNPTPGSFTSTVPKQ